MRHSVSHIQMLNAIELNCFTHMSTLWHTCGRFPWARYGMGTLSMSTLWHGDAFHEHVMAWGRFPWARNGMWALSMNTLWHGDAFHEHVMAWRRFPWARYGMGTLSMRTLWHGDAFHMVVVKSQRSFDVFLSVSLKHLYFHADSITHLCTNFHRRLRNG